MRNTLHLINALSFLLTFMSAAVHAEQGTAQDWIERMNRAQAQLDFEGTFIFARGDKMHTLQITHYHDQAGEWEEFKPMNGPKRTFLRYQGAIWCLDKPDSPRRVSGNKKRNETLSLNGDKLQQIEQYYRISLAGKDRVADRPVQILTIEPRDQYRFTRILGLDEETALPLRVETHNSDGAAIERVLFTQFRLIDRAIPQPVPLEKLSSSAEEERVDNTLDTPHWQFNLPPGFEPLKALLLPQGRGEHYIFSDGLSSVSIFVEQSGKSEQRQVKLGAINSYIEHKYGHRFTVLGEVPVATIEHVANSISPIKEAVQ